MEKKIILFVLFLLAIFSISWCFLSDNNGMFIWDAGYYRQISLDNYNAKDKHTPAFFPLLPILIYILVQNQYLISIANALFLSVGLLLLFKTSKFKLDWLVFILLTTHFFYFFTPYTESISFIGGGILLYGFKKNKLFLVCLGIIICSLARPIFVLLSFSFVALFFLEWFVLKKRHYKYLLFSALSILATGVHFLYLKLKTGDVMAFFDAQKMWGHKMEKGFTFPFEMNNIMVGFFLVIAFIYCLIAAFYILKVVTSKTNFDRNTLFCAIFICSFLGLMLKIQTPDFSGLNRYILCSPFFVYFALSLKTNFSSLFKGNKIQIIILITLVNLAFWSTIPLKNICSLLFSCLYFYFYFYYNKQSSLQKWSFYTYCCVLLGVQVYFLNRFIHFLWVSG